MLSLARCRGPGCLQPLYKNETNVTIQCLIQHQRGMARGRNYYLRGGSNKQEMSQETRELLRNARNPEDLRWKLGSGIQEPLEMDPTTQQRKRALQYTVKYRGDNINDGDDIVKYYPHKDEEIPKVEASPVLMLQRVKTLKSEPWYNKEYCQQLGLGEKEKISKLSFVPNIPSVSLILFKIKHLLEIKPVTFPNGMPDDFDPDKHGYKLTTKGEFVVHPSLRVDPEVFAEQAEWLKLTKDQIATEGRRHYNAPFKTVLGHDHYHADTRWRDNDKAAPQYWKNQKMKWSPPKKT